MSCLSAYDQDWQDYKEFQEYREYKKNQERRSFAEKERKYFQEQKKEEQKCCQPEDFYLQEQERHRFAEYLEFQEYRRSQEQEQKYCKELEQSRLCELTQIDPDKDRLENFRFTADWLYFKAVQDGLPFTIHVPDDINVANTSFFGGKVTEPKWKYSSGARVACGLPIGLGNWELGLSWSYVRNTASNSKHSDTNHLFTIPSSAALRSGGDLYVDDASGKWKLNFNTIDLTLESPIYINNSFKMRPIIGILASFIHQKNTCDFTQFIGGPSYGANPPSHLQGKNNTWGVGPKFGLGLTIAMPHQCNFNFLASFGSLFGQGKSTMKYSNFRSITQTGGTDQDPIYTESAYSPPTTNQISYKATRMFSVIQVQGAIEKVWNLDCGNVSIAAGWEVQNWLRQQRLMTYGNVSDPSIGADLTLQGPFARINIDF